VDGPQAEPVQMRTEIGASSFQPINISACKSAAFVAPPGSSSSGGLREMESMHYPRLSELI
jgi:hypothetical protein